MPRPARTIPEITEYGPLIPDDAPDIPGRLPYDDGTIPAGIPSPDVAAACKVEYCAICNEEIKPGQPAEFGAPREDEWTGVHLECPEAAS